MSQLKMNINPFDALSSSPPSSDIAVMEPEAPPQTVDRLAELSLDSQSQEPATRRDSEDDGHPMPLDEEGAMIHEGIRDPGFILDCMAWGMMDSSTGKWASECPPLHYFNILRLWVWLHERKPPNPQNVREIRLPSQLEVSYNGDIHVTALNTAYALWAEGYLRQKMFGAEPLPRPNADLDKQIWADESAKFPPMPVFPSRVMMRSPEGGGVPLMHGSTRQTTHSSSFPQLTKLNTFNPQRADSVVAGLNRSNSPQSTRGGTYRTGSTSEGSPVRQPASTFSALAPTFSPFSSIGTIVNLALSSRAALPVPPGQLPGTFDILMTANKSEFAVLHIMDAPFNVSINEILTHLKLGEREGLVHYGPDNPAIHIIQDRADSKTHEVYVEMLNREAANRVLHDMPKRGIKIGSTGSSRKIRVSTCKTEDMMKAIFPRPSKTHTWQFRWAGADPDLDSIPDGGFIGYVSSEDMHNARDWAEHPRKAKHAEDAPQRVYEFMISTLIHLPKDSRAYGHLKGWTSPQEFVDRLFTTCVAMIRTLGRYLDDPKFAERHLRREHSHLLHFRLLKRFNQTCYDFPLFSELQKSQLLNGV